MSGTGRSDDDRRYYSEDDRGSERRQRSYSYEEDYAARRRAASGRSASGNAASGRDGSRVPGGNVSRAQGSGRTPSGGYSEERYEEIRRRYFSDEGQSSGSGSRSTQNVRGMQGSRNTADPRSAAGEQRGVSRSSRGAAGSGTQSDRRYRDSGSTSGVRRSRSYSDGISQVNISRASRDSASSRSAGRSAYDDRQNTARSRSAYDDRQSVGRSRSAYDDRQSAGRSRSRVEYDDEYRYSSRQGSSSRASSGTRRGSAQGRSSSAGARRQSGRQQNRRQQTWYQKAGTGAGEVAGAAGDWFRGLGSGRFGDWISTHRFMLRLLFLPLYCLWLEIILHVYMGHGLAFLPLYGVMSVSIGFFFTLITLPFPTFWNRVLMNVFSFVFAAYFMAETVMRRILQSYYMLSMLETAAGNRLGDYGDVILSTIVSSIPIFILYLIPALIFLIGGRRLTDTRRPKRIGTYVKIAVFWLGLQGISFLMMLLPVWGRVKPMDLYFSDTNVEAQVNELGLLTTFTVDFRYMIVEPPRNVDNDFSALTGDTDEPEGEGSNAGAGGSAGGESESETEAPIQVFYHVSEADLATLAQSSNEDVAWLAQYFNSVQPTSSNEYTGIFEGYNVIELTLEGFDGYGIDEELTPTLWKLTHEGIVCNNFYTALHYGSTSGGECQVLLGLYPKNGSPVSMQSTGNHGTYDYYSLAQSLGREGYQTLGFHNNYDMYDRALSHSNMGLVWRYSLHGLDAEASDPETLLWPQFDSYMIQHSTHYYMNAQEPYYVYYLSVSGHVTGSTGYDWNRVSNRWREVVQASPRFAAMTEGTQAYEACAVVEVDRALQKLLEDLEAAGELDHTLIVAVGDHIPYSNIGIIGELSGENYGGTLNSLDESQLDFDVYRNTLILWTAGMEEPVYVDKPCCQVDILPTVSNLLGIDYDSRMLSGRDILSDDEGLVIFSSRSWLSDRGLYNIFTDTFTPAEGVTMTQDEIDTYVDNMSAIVNYRLSCTEMILDSDFYAVAFGTEERIQGETFPLTPAEQNPELYTEPASQAETEPPTESETETQDPKTTPAAA